MPIGQWFFGFSGRLNRGRLWGAALVYAVGYLLLSIVVFTMMVDAAFSFTRIDYRSFISSLGVSAIIVMIGALIVFVSQLSVVVKRLHDRNKSGWWVLPIWVLPWALAIASWSTLPDDLARFDDFNGFGGRGFAGMALPGLISFAIWVWAFVELGCLRGTIGPNQFGPDPIPPPYGYSTNPPYPPQPPWPGQGPPTPATPAPVPGWQAQPVPEQPTQDRPSQGSPTPATPAPMPGWQAQPVPEQPTPQPTQDRPGQGYPAQGYPGWPAPTLPPPQPWPRPTGPENPSR